MRLAFPLSYFLTLKFSCTNEYKCGRPRDNCFMDINSSTHHSWLNNSAKSLNPSASHPCNSRSDQVKTPLLGRQPPLWNKLMSEMVVNVMSYLPINEVIKCYTLDKRTCHIIRELILKQKIKKFRAPSSRGIYSKEYYKYEIRPWLISLKQNALVHHLDFAIQGNNFHQLLDLLISEVFKSSRKVEILKQPVTKNSRQIRFNREGSIAFIKQDHGGVSILACHRGNRWSQISNTKCNIRTTHGDGVFSEDGTKLALCDNNGTLIILSFERDESGIMKVRQKVRFQYNQEIRQLQFSPDGLDLFFNTKADSGQYHRWFIILSLNSQGQWLVTKELKFASSPLCSAQFSPDGSCFVFCSLDTGIFKFFTNKRQSAPLWSCRGVLDRLYNAFSAPGCRWVEQLSDRSLRGLRPRFSPDGMSVEFLKGTGNQTFMAKQVQGCWVQQQEFDERFISFTHSPDGQAMAAIFNNKHSYDALCIFARNSAGNWVESHRYFYQAPEVDGARVKSGIVSLEFTADSESLWICHRPSILDIRQKVEGQWQVVYRAEHLADFKCFRDSSDGKTLAISDTSGIFSVLFNNGRIWTEQLRIEARNLHCCFSRDNQLMVVVTGAGYARILALQNQRWRFRTDWFLACPEGQNSVKFCPNNVAIVIDHQRDFSSDFGFTRQSVHIFNLIPVMTPKGGIKELPPPTFRYFPASKKTCHAGKRHGEDTANCFPGSAIEWK